MSNEELCELACLLRIQPLVSSRSEAQIPRRSGIYAGWREGEWQCLWFAGASNLRQRIIDGHYAGLREGDAFSLYVYDQFVHPRRVAEESRGLRRNSRGLNKMTRDWVRANVRFQFIELPKERIAEAEAFFRQHWQPLLNGLPLWG